MENLELDPIATDLLESLVKAGFDVAVSVTQANTFVVNTGDPDGFVPDAARAVTFDTATLASDITGGEDFPIPNALLDTVNKWRNRNFITPTAHLIRWNVNDAMDGTTPDYHYAERIGHPGNGAWLYAGNQIGEEHLTENIMRWRRYATLLTTEQEFMRVNGSKK